MKSQEVSMILALFIVQKALSLQILGKADPLFSRLQNVLVHH